MKKDRINTSSIREIKHSFKRFLSLLVMSMLGVLVFVGLKMAAPDMMKSLDKYYDDNNFYDIKIVSTLGLTNDDIYVFDCMGRGDVPVLTQTRLPKGISSKFVKDFNALESRAQNLIRTAGGGKWFCLPCNYSDNASFIANGIPAVAITILPSEDVSLALAGGQPETWKKFHTHADNFESLTPQAFDLTFRILNQLAMQKTLV